MSWVLDTDAGSTKVHGRKVQGLRCKVCGEVLEEKGRKAVGDE